MPGFNCECETTNEYRTLAELRRNLLIRLGYAAQAANPPPGMVDLLNSFIDGAHRQVYRTYKPLRTARIFTWTLVPGERYYGLLQNDEGDDSAEVQCNKIMDPDRVIWAGVEDLNGMWYPLLHGIPPEYYTSADLTPGWPQYYEIRSCIEVFPAPQAAYKLRIKGYFGPLELVDDDDQPIVDDEAVFLLALGNAKSHYNQPDAQQYFQQAFNHIGSIVAGQHRTARYVPGEVKPPPATPPLFLPLVE